MPASLSFLGSSLSAACVVASLSISATAQCDFSWQSSLPIAGTNNSVAAVVSVPQQGLYAAGYFLVAGDEFVNYVTKWNGTKWQPLGAGLSGTAVAMTAAPNGDVVVGGFFTAAGGNPASHLARWDGSTWSEVGGGLNGVVTALATMPNGDLLVGGNFTTAGGQSILRAGIWNGTSWSQVGTGINNGGVYAFAVAANGDIAVGGTFTQVGGSSIRSAAIWNGSNWVAAAGNSIHSYVLALAYEANGDLLLGGNALDSLGAKVARFNGSVVQPIASPFEYQATSILVESNGSVLVSGSRPGNGTHVSVARLQGGVWTVLKTSESMSSLAMHSGRIVAAGGNLGAVVDPTITEFDGSSWSPIGDVFTAKNVTQVVAAPGGGVFVSGQFAAIGNNSAPRVAHWDGSNWSSLGAGLDDGVTSMVVTRDGDLVVAGAFTTAGGTPANHIARWNGNNWSTLGAGFAEPPIALAALPSGGVVALLASAPSVQVFDGTSWTALPQPQTLTLVFSPAIVALPNGDLFVNAASSVLRFDGTAWTSVIFPVMSLPVRALAVSMEGTLLAAGTGVFAWDGSSFQPVGAPFGTIRDLMALPNGDLIAAGEFDSNPNQSVRRGITRWDGAAWTTVSGGTEVLFSNRNAVQSVAFTEAGELVAVGQFASMGGVVTANIARAATNCPASASVFGAGCSGSAGPVSLRALDRPWSGATFHSRASGMAPMSLAVHAVGTTSTISTLPLGAPGCGLFVQPVVIDLLLPVSGSVDASVQIPANVALVGLALRSQVIGIERNAASSITSLTSSNALDLVIGAF